MNGKIMDGKIILFWKSAAALYALQPDTAL